MFKQIFSGFSLLAAIFSMASIPLPAIACTDTAGQWDCVHDGTGTFPTSVSGVNYVGTATLYHWYTGTLWCNDIRADGDITISSGTATVEISNFTGTHSTNNPDCANVTFQNFNWTATDGGTGSPTSHTDTTPVAVTFYTPEVYYSGTQICYDSVPATFNNDGYGGSFFDYDATINGWAGSCTVDGTLYNSSISAH